MEPDKIDELFRKNLQDKTSPLPDSLWSRLQDKLAETESHSIDNLFRSKLSNHESPLPTGLLNRLEEQLNPSGAKSRPMWAWYAAACLTLLLSVLGMLKYQDNSRGNLAEVKSTNIFPTQPTDRNENNSENNLANKPVPLTLSDKALNQVGSIADKTAAKRKENSLATPLELKPVNRTNNLNRANKPVLRVDAPASPDLLAANVATEKRPTKTTVEAQTNVPIVIGASQIAQAEPLQVNVILATETSDIQEENVTESRSKFKLAKQVAKQLLKLKNGEKPDLQELGLASSYTMEFQTKKHNLSRTINL